MLPTLLALIFGAAAQAQTPTSFRLSIGIPTDPVYSLGDTNGAVTALANLSLTSRLAPGSLFTLSVVAVFPDGRFGNICNVDLPRAQVVLRSGGGETAMSVSRLPPGFDRPRQPGCDTLSALLPRDVPLGPAEFLFTYSDPAINVRATAPILIESSVVSLFTPRQTRLAQPFVPGEPVTVDAVGVGLAKLEDIFAVMGGTATNAISVEPLPDQPGFDRIRFLTPAEGSEGCYVPVHLTIAGRRTQPIFLPKATQPGPCRHPWGLDESTLRALDAGERIWVGQPMLSLFASEKLATFNAQFQRATVWRVAALAAPEDDRLCHFASGVNEVAPPSFLQATLGDAGNPLRLSTLLENMPVPALNLSYSARFSLPPDSSTEWRLEAPGGAHIGPFQTSVSLPPLPAWTPPPSIAAGTDVSVEWNAEGLTDSDRLSVIVQSMPGEYLECRAPATSGALTLPAQLLGSMPRNNNALIVLLVTRPFERPALFPLPLAGGGTGIGLFQYRLIHSKPLRLEERPVIPPM